jgi:hypothetical protein
MGKLTNEQKKARAEKAATTRAAKKAEVEAAKKAADEAETDGNNDGDESIPVEPCPSCPSGMRRLRSRFPSYVAGDVKFNGHCALVDEATFDRLRNFPHFGQGLDFWEDAA